jgi:hypothetical protein
MRRPAPPCLAWSPHTLPLGPSLRGSERLLLSSVAYPLAGGHGHGVQHGDHHGPHRRTAVHLSLFSAGSLPRVTASKNQGKEAREKRRMPRLLGCGGVGMEPVKAAIFLASPLKCLLGSGLLAVLDSRSLHCHTHTLSLSSMDRKEGAFDPVN